MDEEKKLTPFEQAFFDYRQANEDIEKHETRIYGYREMIARAEKGLHVSIAKRSAALSELRRGMTPDAFAELTAVQA